MLAGRPPFVEQSIPALMVGHTTQEPPSLAAVRPDCPPALLHAVERMLAKNPADRFATLEEAITAADARPLSPDDATRGTLVALAKNSSTRHLIARVRTPRSPVPLMHRSGPQGQPVAERRPRRTGLLIGGGLAAGVAVTAALALALRPGSPPVATPSIDSAVVAVADSAPPETTIAAEPDAVAPAPAPGPTPAPASRTSGPATNPAPPAAARAIPVAPPPPPSAAVDSVLSRITPQVLERAAPTPDTTARAPAPPPPPPDPAPVADPRAEIEAVVQAYARALEAGRLDMAVRLFPAMPADQRQGLEAFYRDGGSMQTRWQVLDVAVAGTTATLRIVGTNVVRTTRTGPSEQRVALRARLERGSNGWRLVALVN
jgi:hypothetical protein